MSTDTSGPSSMGITSIVRDKTIAKSSGEKDLFTCVCIPAEIHLFIRSLVPWTVKKANTG
jgi:hypothetical protein